MTDASDNVQLLKEGTEAYNRGDMTFVLSRAADDIEVYADRSLMNSGTFHGLDGFAKWMTEWNEAWSEITIDVTKVEEIEGRFLMVEAHQSAVGSGSGVPVEMDIIQLIEVRDGQISRFHLYSDRETADAALADLR